MEKNVKGHYMVNIAFYLFGNLSASEAGNSEVLAAKSLEQAWTSEDWGDDWFELTMISTLEDSSHVNHDNLDVQHDRRVLFDGFLQRRLQLNGVVSIASESQVQQPNDTAVITNGPGTAELRPHHGHVSEST
eukprot:s1830_g13.t1